MWLHWCEYYMQWPLFMHKYDLMSLITTTDRTLDDETMYSKVLMLIIKCPPTKESNIDRTYLGKNKASIPCKIWIGLFNTNNKYIAIYIGSSFIYKHILWIQVAWAKFLECSFHSFSVNQVCHGFHLVTISTSLHKNNDLFACEFLLGSNMICQLTSSPMWNRYTYPTLASFLSPLLHAKPAEPHNKPHIFASKHCHYRGKICLSAPPFLML